jgi:glycosyltransferase involved in cell wall biosynthesis
MMPPSRRPCVLMTCDAVGGVWVYAGALARAVARHSWNVHLVVMGPSASSEQIAELSVVDGIVVEQTDLALEWLDPEARDLPRAQHVLEAIARRVAPDLVHLNSYREACFDWPAPVLVAAHSCVRSWWAACRGSEPDEARWDRYACLVERGLATADMWVAPTAALRDEMQALYAPPRPGRVIWNGISGRPRPAAKQPFILAAGRLWDEAKNIHALVRIADSIAWPIRIAGPCSVAPELGRFVPGGRVELLGELPRTALADQMARAAIFAAPALYEPFGLAILEAAAAGCALILADIPSLRELWDGAAMFVDPRSDSALRDGLARLTAEGALRQSLGRSAAQRARRYSVGAMAESYRGTYDALRANQQHAGTVAAILAAGART